MPGVYGKSVAPRSPLGGLGDLGGEKCSSRIESQRPQPGKNLLKRAWKRPESMSKKKAYIETYGCQMNVSDSQLMQGILVARGYDVAEKPEDADVILVNTCAIRDHAEQRVFGRVGELYRLKRDRPDLIIGVTGCMAQRLGPSLMEKAPYVELVMGPDAYRKLPEVLAGLRPESTAGTKVRGRAGALPVINNVKASALPNNGVAVLDFEPHENYEGLEIERTSKVSAWVPVQRGCNYRCTYCIVPYVRGSEKNRDPHHILNEVRGIAEQGIPEVVLLGQTVNSYEHGEWTFPRLLREVARTEGIRRVRFTSPHPNDFTPDLVTVMAEEPTVCKQLHLPVQSGSNRTLKRMLRRYTVESYLEKLAWVRRAIPDIALSTDIIVAFPGETAEEYEATLELMRTVRYDDAFLYKYSLRAGTPATRLPQGEFIADDVAQERLARIIELHRSIQAEINRTEVGTTTEVLVERVARTPGDVLGRTESNKVVAFPGDETLMGKFLDVRITATTGATFIGEATTPVERVA
jgi:tRNA-2-methylthio-N6-dimethylallyladenosine synthase